MGEFLRWRCHVWLSFTSDTFMILVLLYAAVAFTLMFPFHIFHLASRYFLLRTLWRILLPLQAITFADFFLADILTSMSKVFSDLERSVSRMVHRQIGAIQAVSRKAYFIAIESEIQPNRFVLKEQVNFCKVTRSCRTSRLGRKNKKQSGEQVRL
ncbi:uncharacterized protein [Henckelia pumila]|uniref:uncharacterized protein n=1 Tax=Henckelia pumila TaxID=405737 RepID=UPI003C6DE709